MSVLLQNLCHCLSRCQNQFAARSKFISSPRPSSAFGDAGEHSPGRNHLFSFITGKIGKVREIIRTLEWSQSSVRPVRSPLRVIHLALSFPYTLLLLLLQPHLQRWTMDIIHEHLRCTEYCTTRRSALITRKLHQTLLTLKWRRRRWKWGQKQDKASH